MVKLFTQDVSFTSSSTIIRDSRTLEDQVNTFLRDPKVIARDTQFFTMLAGANQYYVIKLEYDIKQGG
jgi:hypothetical protein